jgi:peptidoglycan glycosyltransferase
MTGIGQGNLTMTPLHLALIGSAVANNGTAYRPTVVDEIRTAAGRNVFRERKEKIINKALSKKSCKKLREALHESALHYGLNEESLGTVYAKTGTAETPSGTHTYIVVFNDSYSFCISLNRGFLSSDLYGSAWQLAALCNQLTAEGGD